MPTSIYFDTRWCGNHGIGRFASELQNRLPGLQPLPIMGAKLSPIDPLASTWALRGKKDAVYLSPGFNPPLRSPIPVVFTVHDLIHLNVPSESSFMRRAYYAAVVRPAALAARRILTVSLHSQKDICDWCGLPPEKVRVVGNGVSPVFGPQGERHTAAKAYFLHVGRRASHKNIPVLLQAFARCRAASEMRLLFTGDADGATVLAARALGLETRIGFAGQVSDEALARLYRGATALVFPSLYEGFGLPIIEAMACGTPVVTSNATSMAEVAGPGNAVLVDAASADELAQAMDRVAQDAELRQMLMLRGSRRALDFDWKDVATRTLLALDAP